MTQDANKQGMPPKRLAAIIAALVLVLAVVGVTAWFLLPGDTGPRDKEAGETALLHVSDRNGSGPSNDATNQSLDQEGAANNSASGSSGSKDSDRLPDGSSDSGSSNDSGNSGSSSEGSQDSGSSDEPGDEADDGGDEGDGLTGHFVAPERERNETEFFRKW